VQNGFRAFSGLGGKLGFSDQILFVLTMLIRTRLGVGVE